MSFSGFIREIDSVGRVVIPKQLRKELGLTATGSKVNITSDGSSIIIKKCDDSCVFCKNSGCLTAFNGSFICAVCLDKIKNIA